MFIPLTTLKGERLILNLDRILFFAETKKGCSVILDDGTLLELQETYEEVMSNFVSVDD